MRVESDCLVPEGAGFGFSFAGRTNAEGAHLHYVKTIRHDGAASNVLRIGDRILKVE